MIPTLISGVVFVFLATAGIFLIGAEFSRETLAIGTVVFTANFIADVVHAVIKSR
jgi:hypothetical protein